MVKQNKFISHFQGKIYTKAFEYITYYQRIEYTNILNVLYAAGFADGKKNQLSLKF
jgi:hypothetical protein